MDKIRLIDAINSSKLDYNDIYDKVNVIKKKKSNFNIESYNEIVYLQMYIYHLKNGINTLSKNGNIPELIPKRISYEQFKIEFIFNVLKLFCFWLQSMIVDILKYIFNFIVHWPLPILYLILIGISSDFKNLRFFLLWNN